MFYNDQIFSTAQKAKQDATELSVMVEQATRCGLYIESFNDKLEVSVRGLELVESISE